MGRRAKATFFTFIAASIMAVVIMTAYSTLIALVFTGRSEYVPLLVVTFLALIVLVPVTCLRLCRIKRLFKLWAGLAVLVVLYLCVGLIISLAFHTSDTNAVNLYKNQACTYVNTDRVES